MDKYLRVKEVAMLTSMGVSTIWALTKRGDFPAPIKLSPRVTVWPKFAVQAWLESKGGQDNG